MIDYKYLIELVCYN